MQENAPELLLFSVFSHQWNIICSTVHWVMVVSVFVENKIDIFIDNLQGDFVFELLTLSKFLSLF